MQFDPYIPRDFSGVIAIKQDGAALHEAAYGFADAANQRLNRLDTKFVTASAGKAFTATAILMLIEQGKLSLDSTLGELLDFELNQIDPSVTIRQLLTHTSGTPDYADESVAAEYSDLFIDYPCYKVRTNRDVIPLFINMPMLYPPGNHFHYNSGGFVILALVMEIITGMPFDEYLAKTVFAPCGMVNTSYQEYDRPEANTANVYILDKTRGDYYTNIYSSTAKGMGDGGAFTTAADLECFWRGLYGGKLVSPEMLAEMTKPQTDARCYGYGLWMEELDGRFVPHFEGCEPGIGCFSAYDAERDLLVTLITNRGDNIWDISRSLMRHFYDNAPEWFDYGE
jgi:CubicO group peptidase (beta-lactamase class C family)